MKNLICLLFISLVMLFSCSRDILNEENLDLKKAKVPIPMKGPICMTENNATRIPVANTPVIDPSSGKVLVPAITLSGAAFLNGNLTHMGEMDPVDSHMTGRDAYLDLEALSSAHKIVLKATYDVVITGANGDYITMVSHINIDATDKTHRTITGDWTITGGSGNFENAAGSGTLNGVLPCWDIDGTLEYPR